MKILILGSTGFIGRNLKEYFEKMPSLQLDCPTRQQLDILDERAVDAYLRQARPDVVINAAICRNPRYFENRRTEGELSQDLRMYHILEKRQDMYGKMIYFGSGAEYGKHKPIISVHEEELNGDLPLDEYGFAKYIIGKSIENSNNIYNLRIFGLYGKYENWKTTFISGACCKALRGLPITIRKNVIFDYLYISDFCKIIYQIINNTPKFHTYNLSSGRKTELLELAMMIKEITGSQMPIYVCESGYANEYTASNSRLIEEFNIDALTSYRDSIIELLTYYESILEEIDLLSLLY